MAQRYTAEADKRLGVGTSVSVETTEDPALTLRKRARYITGLAAADPEPQWQKAKLLAARYIREAEALERRPA